MNKGSRFLALPIALSLLALGGCSNTVRYLTTMKWTSAPPGAAGAPGAAEAAPAEGRTLYVTYWEGTCMPKFIPFFGGCSLGDSKIRRCNVKADNQMDCVDENDATTAIARKK